MTFLKKMIRNEEAATAIEYGLIAALIAVAGISAFTFVGNGVKDTFNGAANEMNEAVEASGADTTPSGN